MDASRIETPVVAPPLAPRRLIGVIGLTLALAYLVMLSGAWLQGQFLTDAENRPIANDFVDVYAAGRMALSGDAASAYDWPLHKAAEVRALGHDFSGYYGWHYPPPFLFVAAVLALLPYLGAVFVWLAAATLVATPYVYTYDVTVLAVAVGFLLHYALERGFTVAEICGLAASAALILVFPHVGTQEGLAAVLIVLALVMERARAALRVTPPARRLA